MEEFCLDCWNKSHQTTLKKREVILSEKSDMEACSICGKVEQVVVRVLPKTVFGWLECQYWSLIDKFEL